MNPFGEMFDDDELEAMETAYDKGHGSVPMFASGCRCETCCDRRDHRVARYLWERDEMHLFIPGKDWPVDAR